MPICYFGVKGFVLLLAPLPDSGFLLDWLKYLQESQATEVLAQLAPSIIVLVSNCSLLYLFVVLTRFVS